MFSFLFGSPDLKTEIKKKLKTYQQLKEEYNFSHDGIYRSSNSKFFEKSGMPKDNQINYYGYQVSAPVFFSVDPEISHKEGCQSQPNCITWRYTPKQNTDVTRYLFLDLTGELLRYENNTWVTTSGLRKYILNNPLIKLIYDKIAETRGQLSTEILSAYGYNTEVRHSVLNNDRFFSLELFRLIQELNIEAELNCVFLGYFHGLVKQQYSPTPGDSWMPADDLRKAQALTCKSPEFSIPYEKAANPLYITPVPHTPSIGKRKKREDGDDVEPVDKKGGQRGGRIKSRKRNKQKSKTYKKKHNKPK